MAHQVAGKVQIGPPKILAAVVRRLIPPSCRQELWADLIKRYRSPQHLIRRTAKAIKGAIVSQVGEPGYGSLVAGEVCILYVALSGALPPMAAIALALAVSAALIFRDGYMDRTKRGYVCFLWDAIAATALVAGLQFLWTLAATGLTLIFAAQWIVGGVAVSFFRLIFRMPEDPRQRLFDEYRDTMQINVLWMVACEALMFTSLEAVPAGGDAFFAAAPIVIWGMALRLQSDSLGAVKKDPFLSLRENPLRQEAAVKKDLLIVPSSTIDGCALSGLQSLRSWPSLRWI